MNGFLKALVVGSILITSSSVAFAGDIREAAYRLCIERSKASEDYCKCASQKPLDQYLKRYHEKLLSDRLEVAQQNFHGVKNKILGEINRTEEWFGEYCDMADRLIAEYEEIVTVLPGESMSQEQNIRASKKRQEMEGILFRELAKFDPDHSYKSKLSFHYGVCKIRRDVKGIAGEYADYQTNLSDGSLRINYRHFSKLARKECKITK